MNTNKITQVNGTVNVTIHKNHLAQDNSSYAKVKRNTAGMNNVIATILSKTKVFDEASLIATSILFKDAILELILPENLESQKKFVIAIKTQSTRGKPLLKSVKTMIYDEAIVVN